jgi:maleate isomerase
MVFVHGWRGKIGVIFPAPGSAPEVEFHENVPEGVAVYTSRLHFEEVSPEGLAKMGEYLDVAAGLVAQAEVDVIAFVCTTGSLIKGIGYDKEIVDRLERATGIPVTTTSTAVVEALNAFKLKRLDIYTPYPDDVNQAEKAFLESSGFEVTSIRGLGLRDPTGMPQVTYQEMYRLVKDNFTGDCDGIFVSCTGISVLKIIEMLEEDFKKPVVTSNQATLWLALKKIRVGAKIEGIGQLFNL